VTSQAVDASAPFEKAVKHLFRHLHDSRNLRTNPLVRRFFEDPGIRGSEPISDAAVLDRIHELVRLGAESCRGADLLEGKNRQAYRQHAIIVWQCLEQRPIGAVAATLRISQQHCYRERASICRRVARFVYEHNYFTSLDYLGQMDEFQILIDAARRQAASGDMATTFRQFERLVSVAPSRQEKIETLRLNSLAALSFGDVDRAEQANIEAGILFDEMKSEEPPTFWRVAQACIDMMESELAYHRGDIKKALSGALQATSTLREAAVDEPARIKELQVEALCNCAGILWNDGSLEKAYEIIAQAESNLRHVRASSTQLRARVIKAFWRVRWPLLLSPAAWCPAWQRLRGLTKAFEEARASGILLEMADTLSTLSNFHATLGNTSDAHHVARIAISLARQAGNETRASQISIDIAVNMLYTTDWEHAISFLPSRARLTGLGPAYFTAFSHFDVLLALRSRHFKKARALAFEQIESCSSARWFVKNSLVAALAAHHLQDPHEAQTLIETAIPAAESLASALILRDAYNAASTITGNPRFKREADELTYLIKN